MRRLGVIVLVGVAGFAQVPARDSLLSQQEAAEVGVLRTLADGPPPATSGTERDACPPLGTNALGLRWTPEAAAWQHSFLTDGQPWVEGWRARHRLARPVLEAQLAARGLPVELAALPVLESGLLVRAVSVRGAAGPWQLSAPLARRLGLRVDFWVDERLELDRATTAAVEHLAALKTRHHDWATALTAWNAGSEAVDASRAGQQHLSSEALNFAPKLAALLSVLQCAGTRTLDARAPDLTLETVHVPGSASLETLATWAGLPFDDVARHNPSLGRFGTPPGGHDVHLPAVNAAQLRAALGAQREWPPPPTLHHVVEGETVTELALQAQLEPTELARANGLPETATLTPGMWLGLPSTGAQPTLPLRLAWVDVAALGVIALVLARTLALVGLATRQARRLAPRAHSGQLVSVVIPAWNEQASLEQTAAAVLASDYPALELIIIDDGSTDDTARLADELARTDARVVVHHHGSNQGKPAALNAGFARARGAVVITVDADTRLERHCVAHLVAALETSGAQAVAANVKVANRGGWLGVWQSLEYVVSLNVGRRAHDLAGSITTVPGAASAWRRQAVLDAGGFSARSLTEDTDLSLVLLRRGGRLHYAPAALAFTTVPERPGALFRQRRRWLFGNVSCVRLHLGCLRGVTPTRLRWVGYPDFVFTTVVIYVLPLLALAWAPHAVALWGAGACVAAVATLFGVDLLVAVLAYALDGERKRELLHAPLARLVWPFFLWVVLLGAGAFALRGRRPPWRGRPLLQR